MPENVKKWLEIANAFLRALSIQKKILLGVLSGAILVSVIVGTMIAQRDPYKVLYTDLQSDEVRSIVKKLGDLKIPNVISEDRTSISVPTSLVDSARMELAKEGIPGQDVVGFEKFDGSTLGMSSYAQRINYVRAVQGELTRSIERLKAVRRARVHISIPPKKTFLEEEEPPKASVVLELREGLQPSKSEINGIAHLVASAVEGLKVDQISIVDTKGNFIFRPGSESAFDKPDGLLELQRSLEHDYESRVEEILYPVIGVGKVRAKVTVEIDQSRVNMTEETYDTNNATPQTSVKDEETTTGTRPNPQGIPGSRSNLPGAEVQNPPVPVASSNSEKITQNLSYAIPKKVTVTNKPSGSIKRLTVAVLVDGHYSKAPGAGSEMAFTPRSDEELQSLKKLVENVVGFDEGRRDSISITSMRFSQGPLGTPEEGTAGGSWWSRKELAPQLIRNGLIGLLGLAFIFLVLRPFLKWFSIPDVEPETTRMLPRTVAELEAAAASGGLKALSAPAGEFEDAKTLEKKTEEQLREHILQKLQQAPKKASRVVQDWIDEAANSRLVEN